MKLIEIMTSPLSFNKAKLTIVKGKDNKNFPPIANKIAKITNPQTRKILSLGIFFLRQY